MSDKTLPEQLRSSAFALENHHICGQACIEAADSLDAMQWRDEPPDSDGDWVRRRDGRCHVIMGLFVPVTMRLIHQPGDLWFKLPEFPK